MTRLVHAIAGNMNTTFLQNNIYTAIYDIYARAADFHPNLLASAPRSEIARWTDLLVPVEAIDLGWSSGDFGLALKTLALACFPSVENRPAIRSWVRSTLSDGADLHGTQLQAMRRNAQENLGAVIWPVMPPPADPQAVFRGRPTSGEWKPHRANVAFMHRLFSLAEQHGVTVFWLLPPSTPTWLERRTQIGAEQIYEQLARAMLAKHPNLVMIDGRYAGYGASSFYDLKHLHVEGATELTEGLAEVLGRYLSRASSSVPGLWVALPKFRGIPRAPGVEDLDQSKLAVIAAKRR